MSCLFFRRLVGDPPSLRQVMIASSMGSEDGCWFRVLALALGAGTYYA